MEQIPERKTQVLVDEGPNDITRILLREYYNGQWHQYTKMLIGKRMHELSEEEKEEILNAGRKFHFKRKKYIDKEKRDRESLKEIVNNMVHESNDRV